MNDMFLWVRKLIEKIKYHTSHEWCYDRMEAEGYAVMGCCGGLVGGTRATDYLNERCCDCPHLVLGAMPHEKNGE